MKFTDGTPLDAAAVKFNYERIKDPNTPPPSPNRSSANQITDMAVVDPALAVVDVAPAAVVDVDPSPGGAVVVSPGAVVVVSSAAVVAVVDFLPPPPHAAATNAKETTATPTRAHECRPR